MKMIGTGSGLPYIIANLRLRYHTNCLDLNNAMNQLRFRTDEEAEEIAKRHTMIIMADVLPRLNLDTSKLFSDGP